MDKIEKELQKLTQKERHLVEEVFCKLQKGEQSGLNIKKLKGTAAIFRIRKGNIRIIYRVKDGKIFIGKFRRMPRQVKLGGGGGGTRYI